MKLREKPAKLHVGNPNDVSRGEGRRRNAIPESGLSSRTDKEVRGLTASGFRVKRQDADIMRRLIQPWQARSFSYYDIVPEIKYAAQFYSRALSVLRLYPAMQEPDGTLEETDDPDAVEQLQRIQDPGGGTSGLLSSYGRLIFLTGECYLFVSSDKETGIEQWEMLSTDELRVTGAGYQRFKAPSMQAEFYDQPADDDWQPVEDDEAVAYRIWKRHPRYSYLADSTMQGVLDVCEEIVLLTQVIRARARSRMAGAGILLVNGNVIPVPVEAAPDEDPNEDPFLSELVAAMTAPISDEGSASAVVPLVVRIDTDLTLDDVMKHIQIVDPTQLYPETGLRAELRQRLAIGLDMPPEILLGLQDSNHWTSWQIDEQTWKSHLQPVAKQLCDDLTQSFYQPMLRELGVPNWQDYFIAYDATAVINHPDRSKDANELFDRRAIGKAALRDAKGFTDDDAPSEEELNEMIGIALRDGSYVAYGIPSVKAGGIEPAEGELVSNQGVNSAPVDPSEPSAGQGGGAKAAASSGGSADVNKGPAAGGDNANEVVASIDAAEIFLSRVLGAADLALFRARELAGNRLRNYTKREQEAAKTVDGVRAQNVPAALGRDTALRLSRQTERELVHGARDFLVEALRMWGIDDALAEPLGDRIEDHAARTLFTEKPQPLPQSFSNYVVGLYTASR